MQDCENVSIEKGVVSGSMGYQISRDVKGANSGLPNK
jgi:hypothetical protein